MNLFKGKTEKTNEVATQKKSTLPQTIKTIDDLLALALREKSSMEQIDKFMQMKYRHEEREAKKEFFLAMSRFQAEVDPIKKDKHVTYNDYNHASLGQIVKQTKGPLANNLLSYSFDIDDDAKIKVKCIVTHANGHSESTSMTADPDGSGGKNTIQSRGSTITYLSRYTLLARLGLVTADDDNGGQTADDKEPKPTAAPKTHNTKPADVLPPENPGRQAQGLILNKLWKDMKKFNPDKFTTRFFNDMVKFSVGSDKKTTDLTGPEITAVLKELENEFRIDKADGDNIPREATSGN